MTLSFRAAVRPALSAALLAVVLVAVPRLAGAETIRQIIVTENTKTTDDTVRYIAGIDEGDDWDGDVKEEVRQRLVSSGLFKEVDLYSEPHPKGGVKVTILAKDKFSWIIAPTFYNQPTNRGGGLGYGENNLFGENKKLLLYGQVATGDSFFIGAYVDPSIHGTPFSWQADVFLRNERVIEYQIPTRLESDPRPVRQEKLRYLDAGAKLGVTLFRSLKLEQELRGAWVGYSTPELSDGATEEDVGVAPGDPIPAPGAEGWDISTASSLTFDRRANWYGIESGSKISLSYETALAALGSDFDYWYTTLSFERARRYFERCNFIIKGLIEYGHNMPFQQEFSSGGTTLRGYKNSEFRGDFKAIANLEYSIPFFTIKGWAFRGLAFWDTSYTTFHGTVDPASAQRNYLPNASTDEHSRPAPFRNSVGVGVRLYVRQIVLPLLGFDVGYSLETGGIESYFAIGLTDF